ncbi:transcription elongation factor GreA [Treponema sp. JC4]|uniref:transcription elongation factor GreA n=1 Tax=Treponema sp. JC4 TaxID=1124982 RepID=UPI00025B0A6F|nr:transcription elongation factor GreA [Treponema sp. JC4]EID85257.1 transcription elongation factor GreA [Treponema sp. JC4]
MADLIQSVEDMLKEATWTRAAISNYKESDIKELAKILEQANNENCVDQIYAICEEQLVHSKDSIIALYICGITDLKKGVLDNSNLETLVDIFLKNHKESVVESLCEDILNDDSTNRFALRTLADCYAADPDKKDKVWEIYATLVKVDFEEAVLAKVLGEHFEAASKEDPANEKVLMKTAIEYYKKAILRFINQNNYNGVKEVWTKLIELMPAEFDFFQLLRRKIAKSMGETKTTNLMQDLYEWYKANKKWKIAISILKQNLEVDPKDTWARNQIIECYRGRYEGHSQLENYIRSSNLGQSYRNVFEAINDFEKHIAFDKGSFVFHRNWGVGRIRKLDGDSIEINFGKVVGIKSMKLSMAVTALKPLTKDHIWVLKATKTKDDLIKMVKGYKEDGKEKYGTEWTLKTIIKSYNNNCDFKHIKAELVPSILSTGEWTSWNQKAKKILESNAEFGVDPNDINMYTVRENEITPEEKLSNEFKAQKAFFARVDILMKFFYNDITDNTSDYFAEMYSYFTSYLKNISRVDEQVLAAYLVVKRIGTEDKQYAFQTRETFADLYNKIEDPRVIYEELKDTKNTSLRADFISCIRLLPDWQTQYIRMFPTVLDMKMLDTLIKDGYTEDVQKFIKVAFEQFKDYREAVLFMFKECQDKEWYQNAGVSYEKQLITLINIIQLAEREILNHVHSTENKKIKKTATTLLFKDDALFKFMFSGDESLVVKMYTLIDDTPFDDPTAKSQTRNKILEKYPDFKFRVSEEKSSEQAKGMLVTAKKLEEKKAELDNIQNVLLPENAKDVAEARAKGDLKENAEYKAAREQQHMLTLKVQNLQSEIARAVIFDPTTSTTSVVSFATVVTLTNSDSGKDEVFTILGPWESDPDNNVISYMSPFGNAIMNKKVGDTAVFTINDHKYSYTVKAIKKATNY